jgi:phosphoribosylamine-glycine ligase
LEAALSNAYAAAAKIHFDGMHYRTDIGGGVGKSRSARD